MSKVTGNKVKEKNVWNANLLREQAKNNVICNDILCEDMNNFFATIGENLHAKFPNQEPLWKGSSCIHSFSLQLLTQDEILYHLNNLPDKSQTDILDMDCKLLRMARHIISIHLCHFYNLSIQNGIVLDDWKKAKVTPIKEVEVNQKMKTTDLYLWYHL